MAAEDQRNDESPVEVSDETGEVRAQRRRPRFSWKRAVIIAVLTLGVGYVAYVLFLYLYQNHLVYFPSARLESTPESEGYAYEDVWMTTSDGVKIHGWWVPAEDSRGPSTGSGPRAKSRGTVIFCHGNAGNISHRLDTVRIFHRLRMDVLLFDYRGFGKSEGTPTEEGTYLDAEAAWRHVTEDRGVSPGRIVIFGRSLGAAVAAHLAVDRTPVGLILESASTNATDVAGETFPGVPVSWICRFRYDAESDVAKVDCPVLIIHSRDDEMVPFHHGEAVFEAAHEPKTFLELSGPHNLGFLLAGKRYTDALDAFFRETLGETGTHVDESYR